MCSVMMQVLSSPPLLSQAAEQTAFEYGSVSAQLCGLGVCAAA